MFRTNLSHERTKIIVINKTITSLAGVALATGVALTVGVKDVSADTTVKASWGDTVSHYAKTYGVSVQDIEAANGIDQNTHLIFAGREYKIPTATENVVSGNNTNVDVTTDKNTNTQQSTTVNYSNNTNYSQTQTPSTGGSGAEYAARQIASKTGTSVATWEYIIQRESGGNEQIVNQSSGATGLFQLLGHGEYVGMSVDEQVAMAVQVYNAQGFSAWSVTR
ncbi:LysM peptidoglycan-binding domain-containing protein [Streptomyces sp. TRM76323]|uniref:LysM peptidoglycan-binding domain-containing protein n=1 Tax=Streptomyces tamarix TaxID=3078565 RepID=A0ABU3QKT0_9ACTN|nr:LysM peptidoglycan-binding domain-containing protein [Streptomyces tamarix]MDT9683369.1 LysM peptidoglycan-binding domain-containing protein [Streptomyces tamarix]